MMITMRMTTGFPHTESKIRFKVISIQTLLHVIQIIHNHRAIGATTLEAVMTLRKDSPTKAHQ